MIDLHCHYLPGVDDGPADLPAALALARAAAENGILIAVLTPHVYPGRWDNTLSSLTVAFERFTEEVARADIALEMHLGAEVHLHPESLALLAADEIPLIGHWDDRRVVLLEMPDGSIPVGAMRAVELMAQRGVVPMIAHPERNREVMRSPGKLKPFIDAGCLVQLTAASVCGGFGKPAQLAASQILDEGWATTIATDAHNLRHRPPILAEARHMVAARYGPDAARLLTETHPLMIVAGRTP